MARAAIVLAFLAVCALVGAQALGLFSGRSPGGQATSGSATAAPPSGDDALIVRVVTSTAKRRWMEDAAKAYHATAPRSGERPVRIALEHGISGDQLRALQDGSSRPALWSPGDESWITMANDWWKGQHSRALFSTVTPLTRVPLVLAMWEPMARRLGHPEPVSWSRLAALASDPAGWGTLGHPEWGRFAWGHAHPDANSGFLTMVTMIYAAAGKTAGLSVDDLRTPAVRDRVRTLEHTVTHYGLSNVWIDDTMRARGPAYLSAAMQYENTIIEGHRKGPNQPFPLVAVYPAEGMVVATHPIAIPDGDWVDAATRAAAEGFVAFLTGAEGRRLAIAAGIRPAGSDGALGDPFTPANGVAATLPPVPVLEVPGEAILRRVRDLWFESKKPASVVMVIDTSGSMAGEAMDKAKEGALGFLDQMHPSDEVEVIAFSDQITPLVDMGRVGSVREQARERIRGLFARGGTFLHDVTATALDRVAARRSANPDRHYGIILLTDGRDEGSRMSRADLIDRLPKGDGPAGAVKVFTIGYGTQIDEALLREIANRTGARLFTSSARSILAVYLELSANF